MLYRQPPEFASVRIPRGATPDPTSDSAMTVYDLSKGIVYGFHWDEMECMRRHGLLPEL
jgi:hypothetical protein